MGVAHIGDNILQSDPYCHAPIHPAALLPTPVAIIPASWPTVLI
jgi:hypothetical protein